jgi:CheY-like chemotaxis protein
MFAGPVSDARGQPLLSRRWILRNGDFGLISSADMEPQVVVALVGVLPQLVLIGVGALLAVRYRGPIGQFVSTRVGSVSALGLRFDLKAPDIDAAVATKAASFTSTSGLSNPPTSQEISDRAKRLAPHIAGRTVLWVDDDPAGNRIERRLLTGLGITVDIALSNDEARQVLSDERAAIDLVISDIKRDGPASGMDLLPVLNAAPRHPRLIFYILDYDPSRVTPEGAFGITNRPDVLLDLVMDALDRLPERDKIASS